VNIKRKVIKHLHGDIKTFNKEAGEDRELIKALGKKHNSSPKKRASRSKTRTVMHEFKAGKLHSGSKKGPLVKNPKQAIAIALSESRKSTGLPKKPKRKNHAMIR
jgi:type III secretory pathway component EscU